MDEDGFRAFMKKRRKNENTTESCLAAIKELETYLEKQGQSLENLTASDLETFISDYLEKKRTAKFLWSVSYYLLFMERDDLLQIAHSVRAQLIKKKRKPFKLKEFRGIKPEHATALDAVGVKDVAKMLEAGKTPEMRSALAEKTGLDIGIIGELVKLSDLARIPGVKGIRARLYYDAGFDRLDKLRKVTQDELLRVTKEFVELTGFEGIAPLPKEALEAIETAKRLTDVLEW